jgi:hypothetical protein
MEGRKSLPVFNRCGLISRIYKELNTLTPKEQMKNEQMN